MTGGGRIGGDTDLDYYQVLEVPRDADQAEIQRAYRRQARRYHPDLHPEDPAAAERFTQVNEAYQVLSDPETRRRYDAFGPQFRQVPEGMSPEEWARARGAGPGAAGPGRRPTTEGWFGPGVAEDADLEDLLGGLFGGFGRRRPGWGRARGADQETDLPLTVEDAYRGGRRQVTITGPGGARSIDVDIPPGVTDGQRIRLAGQGGQAPGVPAGDLFLTVRLVPHPRYRVEGRDLHADLPLAPWEAALGTTVAVATPTGEARVRVPAGTSSGRRLRLRGRGLPDPRGGRPGDLFAQVKVVVPGELSASERRLFEQLAAVSDFAPRRGG